MTSNTFKNEVFEYANDTFANKDYRGAEFTNCTFTFTPEGREPKAGIFSHCNLEGATFTGCTIDDLTAYNANLRGVIFTDCTIGLISIQEDATDEHADACSARGMKLIDCTVPSYYRLDSTYRDDEGVLSSFGWDGPTPSDFQDSEHVSFSNCRVV